MSRIWILIPNILHPWNRLKHLTPSLLQAGRDLPPMLLAPEPKAQEMPVMTIFLLKSSSRVQVGEVVDEAHVSWEATRLKSVLARKVIDNFQGFDLTGCEWWHSRRARLIRLAREVMRGEIENRLSVRS
jgi:hypothetical protein